MTFIIQDQQGLACPDHQVLDLRVCSCEAGETCGTAARGNFVKGSSSAVGGLGIGVLLLGLLALLGECKLSCLTTFKLFIQLIHFNRNNIDLLLEEQKRQPVTPHSALWWLC